MKARWRLHEAGVSSAVEWRATSSRLSRRAHAGISRAIFRVYRAAIGADRVSLVRPIAVRAIVTTRARNANRPRDLMHSIAHDLSVISLCRLPTQHDLRNDDNRLSGSALCRYLDFGRDDPQLRFKHDRTGGGRNSAAPLRLRPSHIIDALACKTTSTCTAVSIWPHILCESRHQLRGIGSPWMVSLGCFELVFPGFPGNSRSHRALMQHGQMLQYQDKEPV